MAAAASHLLAHDATLAAAAQKLGTGVHPHLVLVDDAGRAIGVLTEEDVRLGLAGKSRPHHRADTLARPLAEFPKLVAADGTPAAPPAPAPGREARALLMAGGRGARLRPLTESLPKPLLAIGDRPLLHRLLAQIAACGIRQCWVGVHYLADKVRASVGDGSAFGLAVEYLHETRPLGTAGALGLLPPTECLTLVMNGDILSDVNLRALLAWHDRHRNQATVATHLFEVAVPFGLAHFDGQRLEHLEEKPTLRLPVNAGIYAFEAAVLREVPRDQPFDMVTWLNELSRRGAVGHFPIVERWHDIGSLAEYERLAGGG